MNKLPATSAQFSAGHEPDGRLEISAQKAQEQVPLRYTLGVHSVPKSSYPLPAVPPRARDLLQGIESR